MLPTSIRSARNWKPGLELAVENRPEGVLLRQLKAFEETRLAQALDWFAAGLDSADALHLAFSSEAEEFVTFAFRPLPVHRIVEGFELLRT